MTFKVDGPERGDAPVLVGYDLSTNGVWRNDVRVRRDTAFTIREGDKISILNPQRPVHYSFKIAGIRILPRRQ